MSDSENNGSSHPTTGGKSLSAIPNLNSDTNNTNTTNPTNPTARLPYKSWRKKYRKMHHHFTSVLDENKRLFRDEQKLNSIARRLREELDGLLDLCLDLNQNPALPPHLRFDISLPTQHTAVGTIPSVVDENITPQAANDMFAEYTSAVQRGQIPHLDLHVIREQLEEKLRVQGVQSLKDLESSIPHIRPDLDSNSLPEEVQGENPPGLLTSSQEEAYLLRQDAKLGDPLSLSRAREVGEEEKHWADMTAREVERQVELLNPMSQHNWLKTHAKGQDGPGDDNESVVADAAKPPTARKRNLAKQVGDRAVGRAREGGGGGGGGGSPSAMSFGEDDDEDRLSSSGGGRKKGRNGNGDGDSTYRIKGGSGSSSSSKGKRKRESEAAAAALKKAKVDA